MSALNFPGTFSKHVRGKANKMLSRTPIKRDEELPNVWWVGASSEDAGKDLYRVELISPETASCTCQYGLRLGGGDCRCSHVLVVRVKAAELQAQNPVE